MMKSGLKFGQENPYEVIVCGLAMQVVRQLWQQRVYADTLMLTGNIDTVAQMSVTRLLEAKPKVR